MLFRSWDAVELEDEDKGGVVAGGAVVRAAGLRRGAGDTTLPGRE